MSSDLPSDLSVMHASNLSSPSKRGRGRPKGSGSSKTTVNINPTEEINRNIEEGLRKPLTVEQAKTLNETMKLMKENVKNQEVDESERVSKWTQIVRFRQRFGDRLTINKSLGPNSPIAYMDLEIENYMSQLAGLAPETLFAILYTMFVGMIEKNAPSLLPPSLGLDFTGASDIARAALLTDKELQDALAQASILYGGWFKPNPLLTIGLKIAQTMYVANEDNHRGKIQQKSARELVEKLTKQFGADQKTSDSGEKKQRPKKKVTFSEPGKGKERVQPEEFFQSISDL
jgi:hypothetical protein